jgi:hypothetical protein
MVGLVVSTVETYFLQLLNKFLNSQDSISNNINQDFFSIQARSGPDFSQQIDIFETGHI